MAINKSGIDIVQELTKDGNLDGLKYFFSLPHTQLEKDVALEVATAYSKIDCMKYLLSIGANFSNYNYQGVYYAVHNNEIEGLKFAIESGVDININDGQLISESIVTAHNEKDTTILKYLLSKGADPSLVSNNILDSFGTQEVYSILENRK